MKKARLNIDQSGFSVMEIIIASMIFALIITAFTGSLFYFNKSAVVAGTKARAVFLAEEGLEATRNIRDENFGNLADGTYGLAVSDGRWIFSGSSDSTDIFNRQLTIFTIDANTKRIDSTVNWDESGRSSGSVSLTTYLTYWQKEAAVAESCGTYCQSLDYTEGICRANDTDCVSNNENHEPGGNSYCATDPLENVCCCKLQTIINSCGEYCGSIGFGSGICRQNSTQCDKNNSTHQSGGDNYCTGGTSADACCCAP